MPNQIQYRIPYTNRDFQSIMDAVKARIPQEIPEWNDFLQSNYGIFIMSTFAAISDWLCFYTDRQAGECFVNTAIGKSSIADIFQLINYQIRGIVPAYTTLQVTLDAPQASDVIIPKYSEFSDTSGANRFVTTIGATISAGNDSVVIPARQGAWQSETFNSNGSVQQRLILGRTDLAEGFIRVWVGQREWTQAVDNTFVGHAPTDAVFRVIKNAINSSGPQTTTPALAPELVVTSVEFGDNLEGFIPPTGSPIRVDYLTSFGDSVRIPAGAINRAVTSFFNTSNESVSVTVLNLTSGAGGDSSEAIYDARRHYPAAFRTMRRAITIYDFQTYVQFFEGVLLSRAYDLNNNADVDSNLTTDRPIPVEKSVPFYQVRVYAIPTNDFSSDALNQSLYDFLQAKSSADKQIVVLAPTQISISISVSIRVYNTYNAEDVRHAVVVAIQDFFTLKIDGEIQIGTNLFLSRLITRIQQVQGVAFLEMQNPKTDVEVQFDQIIRLANVSVSLAQSV